MSIPASSPLAFRLPRPKQLLAELLCPQALSWRIPVAIFLGRLTSSHLLQIHSLPFYLHEFPFVHSLRPLKRSNTHSNMNLSKSLHCWKILTCLVKNEAEIPFSSVSTCFIYLGAPILGTYILMNSLSGKWFIFVSLIFFFFRRVLLFCQLKQNPYFA